MYSKLNRVRKELLIFRYKEICYGRRDLNACLLYICVLTKGLGVMFILSF